METTQVLDTLDTVVMETLSFFWEQKNLPPIDLWDFHLPLVVGSGNGDKTGRIIFRKIPALFATESDAHEKMGLTQVQEVVIISASGEKHAPILAAQAQSLGKTIHLISSTQDSSASQIADISYIFPKITEPYTYNTSTYFGYIYGSELGQYDLRQVHDFIENTLAPSLNATLFDRYNSFVIVLPNEFSLLSGMVETKFIELFGRKIARDVFTYEQMKHATTVVPDDGELFICFSNTAGIVFGENQIDLPVFDHENYGPMMLCAYWVVGQIQRVKPPYFMEYIESYCDASSYDIHPLVMA